ncbi:MAG: undecaprenyldiphospho-muramoylpentapeptide beta-N-acetylglucosaminyltransferase [Vicingaceae bacterium]
MRKIRAIISGGGTGGHIFPAIAIANAIKALSPESEILFVGAEGKMEMEKVPAAGYNIKALPIVGIQRKLTLKNVLVPFKVLKSLRLAKKIIREFKPDVAIGVGGYASGPLLYAATKLNIPTVIQEQNSYPGITNKILAKRVDKICVAYEGLDKYFPKEKILLTGNPVRQDIKNLEAKRERGIEFFELGKDKPVVLVIGGSLGARTINESIAELLDDFQENNIQLLWQTGKWFADKAQQLVKDKKGLITMPFITKMDLAYAVADVIVSRAGALSISELCLVKKPVILIPSPNVAEDHQTKNAMALVNQNAALIVKDDESKENLGKTLFDLMQNEDLQNKLINNISKLSKDDAASVIAAEIFSLAR